MAINWKEIMKQPAYQIRWTLNSMKKEKDEKKVIVENKQSELFNAKKE